MKPRSVGAGIVRLGALGCSVAALLSGGCVTETREAPPKISHSRPSKPVKPAGIRPEQMMLSAGVATDTDGNAYPDLVPVVVYLFGDSNRYALPLEERGVFEFRLIGSESGPLGRWVFPEQEVERAIGDSAAGKCYRFGLKMADGRDVIEGQTASLRAVFEDSETGRRIESLGTVTIRMGVGD